MFRQLRVLDYFDFWMKMDDDVRWAKPFPGDFTRHLVTKHSIFFHSGAPLRMWAELAWSDSQSLRSKMSRHLCLPCVLADAICCIMRTHRRAALSNPWTRHGRVAFGLRPGCYWFDLSRHTQGGGRTVPGEGGAGRLEAGGALYGHGELPVWGPVHPCGPAAALVLG